MSTAVRLTELALARRISWTEASDLLDSVERDHATDGLGDLLADVEAAPPPVRPPTTPWSNPFGDSPRDLAVWIAFSEAVKGYPVREMYPVHWHGASPMEAWNFDLSPDRNPGDHSGVPALPRFELGRQLHLAADYRPRSNWIRERRKALLAEHEERTHS